MSDFEYPRFDGLVERISAGFPAVSSSEDDPMIDGTSALSELDHLVTLALDYRSCGRFDREPCRERAEVNPDDWCAWCILAGPEEES